MDIQVIIESHDLLGEGPVWDEDGGVFYWVDILRPVLQRWDPDTRARKIWEMPVDIGSFALRASGGCIVALRSGIADLEFESGVVTPWFNPEPEMPFTRFNDGKCDRQGRFWAGTMDEGGPQRRGALYRLALDGSHQKMRPDVGISNGLGWSPDNKIFYYTDSAAHTIFAYDFDLITGDIANERTFAQTPDEYVPDGLTVDSEGFVWSAKWDGWKIVRYAPDGSLDREVAMPVQRPTSCIFGGPDLKQLFVTSASTGLTPAEMAEQPQAGNVFVIETDAAGLPEPKYGG